MKETGQKITSIAVEYEKELLAPKLALNSFSVAIDVDNAGTYAEIPIGEIYVSSTRNGLVPEKGRFVIIKFRYWQDTGEPGWTFNAGTSFYTNITEVRDTDALKVTQLREILYSDWELVKSSLDPIKKLEEKNLLIDEFKAGKFIDPSLGELNYRLFTPAKADREKYPLLLFLHGSGERGDSNITQIIANAGAAVWVTPERQAKNPAYVLAPQVPLSTVEDDTDGWTASNPDVESLTIKLIDELIAKEPIDPKRIYVQGLSMGGIGTWDFIIKYPEKFAAAMPICGFVSRNLSFDELKTKLAPVKDLPIRIYVSADDPYDSAQDSRDAYRALRELGSKAAYVEFPEKYAGIFSPKDDPGRGHRSWEAVYYSDDALNWMFEVNKYGNK
jgi:predicted peptidase